MNGSIVKTSINLPAVLDEKILAELGVTPDEIPQVRSIAERIQRGNQASVAEFGRDIAEHTARYADELLGKVNNRDFDDVGARLTEVVSVARSVNLNALTDRRSRLPVVGPIIDRIRLRGQNIVARFESTRTQLDTLMSEIEVTQQGLYARNESLEEMFGAVREEHHLLGLHIAAGKLRLEELKADAETLRAQAQTPTEVQDLADLDALLASLQLRVANLVALQQSALQTLPQIRIVQQTGHVLREKFSTIREITLPSWRRQFMLALGLNEQKNAVELANQIDDMTNELLVSNANLLHRNAVATAKANQRLVIDVKTLQEVSNQLVRTVEDVMKIHREGVEQNRIAERQIAAMRSDIRARLTHEPTKEAA